MNDLSKKVEKKPAVKRMTVSPVRFAPLLSELPTSAVTGVLGNLELVKDVKMNVTVELGRTNLPLKEVLQLGESSVIKLDRLAGESIDLLVNGRLIAKGEVVVIGNNFGIKITQVHRPESLMDSGDDSGYE